MGRPARESWLAPLAVIAILAGAAPAASAAGAPAVTATWVTTVSATSANLRAEVNPEGLSTSYRFEYVTAAAFGATGFATAARIPAGVEPSVGAGTLAVAVVQHLGALQAATSYRYRVVATNSAGPSSGPTRPLLTDEVAPVFSLPDRRGWEMVSPVDKNGGQVQGVGANFGGDVLQAAAAGGAVTYTSASSFAGAAGAPGASQYISRRGASGWSTENVTPATESGAYGDHPDGVPYQLFSGDLATALIRDGRRCAAVETCPRSYSLRDNTQGAVSALPDEEPDLALAGASADLAHLVLSTCAALTADATEVPGPEGHCDPAAANLYERSGSNLELINVLPGDFTGTPGARLAAPGGAISADGRRAYFAMLEDGPLYLHEEGHPTRLLPETVGDGAAFQTASTDGSLAFFTKAGHLFCYDAAGEASADLTPAGEVQGVLGASDDGSHVYFLSAAGLFLWHSGATTAIATGADPVDYPPATGAARVSADGRHLAFLASAELTSYDNDGQPEAYLYEAPAGAGGGAGALTCASCDPSGERPLGPAGLPGASPNGSAPAIYRPRALAADGRRLFFDTDDALVPQDTNNDRDVYQWEAAGEGTCAQPAGCVRLISSGRAEGGASFVDASADGSDAFFLTDGSLVPSDPGSVDLYDARVGGGFPVPPSPIPCLGDACQPLPPTPEDPSPGTLFSHVEGNPPARFAKPRKKRQRHRRHHVHRRRREAGRRGGLG